MSGHFRLAVPLAACFLGAALAAPPPSTYRTAASQSGASGFHEELFGELSLGSTAKRVVTSAAHIAWVEDFSYHYYQVKLDGKLVGGQFDDVESLEFSPDGAHLAFFGKHGGTWFLVLDGKEQAQGYAKTTPLSLRKDGNAYVFGACREEDKCRLVVDGKEQGQVYEDVSWPFYSPDGSRIVFFGKRGKKWIAVVDGKEASPEVEDYSDLGWAFSHGGQHVYAAVKLNKKWTYLRDGAPGPGFVLVSLIALSPDGEHYAYAGANVQVGLMTGKIFGTIVSDGVVGERFQGLGLPTTVFGGIMLSDVQEFGVSAPVFSPAGKLAYLVRRGKGDTVAIIGGEAGPKFEMIVSDIAFSRDGAHFAYIAGQDREFVEVRDHRPGSKFSTSQTRGRGIDVPWIRMTPDGAHLAYEILAGGFYYKKGETPRALRRVVLDGRASKEYDALGIGESVLSADGRHFVFEVHGAKEDLDLVNLDGRESRLYSLVRGTHFGQDGKNVVFFARDDTRFFRVTSTLE